MTPYYQDRDVTLYHGGAMDVLASVDVGRVTALITDPPYGIQNKFSEQNFPDGGTRRLQFGWDDIHITGVVADVLRLALQFLADNGSAFVFCGSDQVSLWNQLFREFRLTPKMAAWVKTCPPPPLPGNWWPSGFELAVFSYRRGVYFAERHISSLGLPDAVVDGLENLGIVYARDINGLEDSDLMAISLLGHSSLRKLRNAERDCRKRQARKGG